MADLCTVADVKALAQKNGTSASDDVWASLVSSASSFIRLYTNRDYALKTYSEIRDGSGNSTMLLRDGPATSITSLTICTIPIPAQPADGQPGYFLDDQGILCLFGYCFSKGKRNVRVTYQAGSNVIPPHVAQACREMIVWAYSRGPRADLVTQALGPDGTQSFSFSKADLPPMAKLILDRESRVALV